MRKIGILFLLLFPLSAKASPADTLPCTLETQRTEGRVTADMRCDADYDNARLILNGTSGKRVVPVVLRDGRALVEIEGEYGSAVFTVGGERGGFSVRETQVEPGNLRRPAASNVEALKKAIDIRGEKIENAVRIRPKS